MSLINQMLRDLESRNITGNEPSILPHNIKATQVPASKMPLLVWSVWVIVAMGCAYWTYQYSKTPSAIVADSIKKIPIPIPVSSYETLLAAPNAVTDTEPKTAQKSPENIITQPVPTVPAVQAMAEVAVSPPIKKMPIVPKPARVKHPADLLYRQAENNVGDSSTVDKLEQVLKLDPRHLKARLLLVKALHNQGEISKAADFLDQSLALFPDNLQFINTRAQLFLQQKNPDAALKTLQRINLVNSSNESYLSLLAATYQQLQSFANAAKVYQKLLTVNPEKAENWLGFALAQEKLGNSKLAREAYQQALSKNTLKESIVGYIKQQLIELR